MKRYIKSSISGSAEDFSDMLYEARVATSPRVLRQLAANEEPAIRAAVAENKNIPEDVLQSLTSDHMAIVIRGLLKNPCVSRDVKRQIAASHNIVTRICIDAWGQEEFIDALRIHHTEQTIKSEIIDLCDNLGLPCNTCYVSVDNENEADLLLYCEYTLDINLIQTVIASIENLLCEHNLNPDTGRYDYWKR